MATAPKRQKSSLDPWTDEKKRLFRKMYRESEILWKEDDPGHKDEEKKEELREEMAAALGETGIYPYPQYLARAIQCLSA